MGTHTNNGITVVSGVFILFVASFLFAGTVFSKGLLEANAIDFNPSVKEEPKELFIPLGFDEDKKFAYLYKIVPENVGCTLWAFAIMNLSSDKVLTDIETPFHDCDESDDTTLLNSFELEVNAALENHGVIKRDMALKAFPLDVMGKKIDACISVRSGELTKGEVTEYTRQVIVFDRASDKAKVIANFKEVKFASVLKVYEPKIEGYFQNPTTKRLAVVVSFSLGGHNPEDYIRRVDVYGASIDIQSNEQLMSMCEKNS